MPLTWDEDKNSYAGGPAITDAAQSAAAPTKAEFDAVVAKFNTLLATFREAGRLAQD